MRIFLILARPHRQTHAQFYNIFTCQFVMITVAAEEKKKYNNYKIILKYVLNLNI